jgi:hypothetical protein
MTLAVKSEKAFQKQMRAPSCRECMFFSPLPFTAGVCRRQIDIDGRYPRITVAREWPDAKDHCGPSGKHFGRKR